MKIYNYSEGVGFVKKTILAMEFDEDKRDFTIIVKKIISEKKLNISEKRLFIEIDSFIENNE